MDTPSIFLFWGIAVAGRWSIPGIRRIRMPWRRLWETLLIYFCLGVVIGNFAVVCALGSYYHKTWERSTGLFQQVLREFSPGLFPALVAVMLVLAAPYATAFALSLVKQKGRPGLAWLMVPYAALFIIIPFTLYDWLEYWPLFPDLEDLLEILYLTSPVLLINGFATALSARTLVQWRKEATKNSAPA